MKRNWPIELIKFALSSFICFLADYGLYALLLRLELPLMAANILARIFSASLNYSLNRWLVFRSSARIMLTAAQYFTLAAAMLAINSALLGVLTGPRGISGYIAKPAVDGVLFAVSWLVQRFIIFRKQREDNHNGKANG